MSKKIILMLCAMNLLYSPKLPAGASYFKTAAGYAARAAQAVQQNRTARFVWNNKFALAGTGLFACNMKKHGDWLNTQQQCIEKSNQAIFRVPIPTLLNEFIQDQAQSFGISEIVVVEHSVDAEHPDPYYAAAYGAGSLGLILVNKMAENQIWDPSEAEKRKVLGVFQHEMTHIKEQHREKQELLHYHQSTLSFCAGTSVYKGLAACAQRISNPRKKLLAQLCAVPVAVGVSVSFFVGDSYKWVKLGYSRFCEKEADEGVLQKGDKERITGLRDFLMPGREYEKKYPEIKKYWYVLSHPLNSERIEVCEKALARLGGSEVCNRERGYYSDISYLQELSRISSLKKELLEKCPQIEKRIAAILSEKNEILEKLVSLRRSGKTDVVLEEQSYSLYLEKNKLFGELDQLKRELQWLSGKEK